MIGLSRLLDPPARAGVRLLLRRDRRADPTTTALLVINPVAPLTEIDPAATAELRRAAAAARSAGSPVMIARTGSAAHSSSEAAVSGDVQLPATNALSAFRGTDLHEALGARGIDRLLVAGFPTHLDIDSTARHAVELGYHVTIVAGACAAQNPAAHAAEINVTMPRIVHAVM
jgi:nicotinamidase-related amidase